MSPQRVVLLHPFTRQPLILTPFGVHTLLPSKITKKDLIVAITPFGLTHCLDLAYDKTVTSQHDAALHALQYAPFFDPHTTYLSALSDEKEENDLTFCTAYVVPYETLLGWHHPLKKISPFIDVVFPMEYLLGDFHDQLLLYMGEDESFFYDGRNGTFHPLTISFSHCITTFQGHYSALDREVVGSFLNQEELPPEFSHAQQSLTDLYDTLIHTLLEHLIAPSSTINFQSFCPCAHFVRYLTHTTPWSIRYDTSFVCEPLVLMASSKLTTNDVHTLSGNISPFARPLPFYKRPSKHLWFSLIGSFVALFLLCIIDLIPTFLTLHQIHTTEDNITTLRNNLSILQSQHAPSKEAQTLLASDTKSLEENLTYQQKACDLFFDTHEKSLTLETLSPLFVAIHDCEGTLKKVSFTSEKITVSLMTSSALGMSRLYATLSRSFHPITPLVITHDEKTHMFISTLSLKKEP